MTLTAVLQEKTGFVPEIWRYQELKKNENDNAVEENQENEPILCTQEIIEDARERRHLRLRGKKEHFQCDICEFESGSKTLLTKHVNTTHKEMRLQETQEMRKRYSCYVYLFKPTSKTHHA